MTSPVPFDDAARIPSPGDNVAIASRRLEPGARLRRAGEVIALPHTVLEGHRFAIVPIRAEELLLSWGLPFGQALRAIAPGEYVCNAKILRALRERHVDFPLPEEANFKDYLLRYKFDETAFLPGKPTQMKAERRTFRGFRREGRRGVGTRNYIAVVGASSRAAGFARALAERFRGVAKLFPGLDGVVPVAHTEGGGAGRPNNLEVTLRTLCGFLRHPNLGAVLVADLGDEPVNNAALQAHLARSGGSLDGMLHVFLSIGSDFAAAMEKGEEIIRQWLAPVSRYVRTEEQVEHLKLGLQCGGSDAFSGVSGNPLIGWLSREVVAHGGAANLAETDELIGAESYILANTRDLATARAFLGKLERFQERVAWHGHSAESNPSGGNNFRGLYNIAIKSIGAARKKDPETRLDWVIDYADPMPEPGFYFMDSPGNDLESIAGQVGSGCNLILFATGNGSITNFPFVPTIKIMTNTPRFRMLAREMDVNAGRYMDGLSMEVLGAESFELLLAIASGQPSAGEKAGHSQVQLWREWRQTDASKLAALKSRPIPSGEPLALAPSRAETVSFNFSVPARLGAAGSAKDRIGLIVPTSLCAGQIARLIAEKLNQSGSGLRYVALAHTEGCGNSAGEGEALYMRTMAGYLAHPSVEKALMLEHGCEKTHNDAMSNFLAAMPLDSSRFGRASIQLDGGIEQVIAKVSRWFQSGDESMPQTATAGLEALRIALASTAAVPHVVASAWALLARDVVEAGGTIVAPDNSALLASRAFTEDLLDSIAAPPPTIAYGQPGIRAGLHVMETQTDHYVETLTGLGATGVDLILVWTGDGFAQGHPMLPVLQLGSASASGQPRPEIDLAVVESESAETLARRILERIVQILSRSCRPAADRMSNLDFQMTRGHLGISM